MAVKDGGAVAIMSAFNFVGGVWAGANGAQNIDILRNEWGFKGIVLTDWSDGSGSMNTRKGVRGGNDVWLNPNKGNNRSKLDRNNPVDITLAKQSVKNVVYTICRTRYVSANYKLSEDELVKDYLEELQLEAGEVKTKIPWWRPLTFSVDIVAGLGVGVWMFFVWKPKKIIDDHKKEADATSE